MDSRGQHIAAAISQGAWCGETMTPPDVTDDFIEMLRACTDHAVEFIVVAHALAVHGIARAPVTSTSWSAPRPRTRNV